MNENRKIRVAITHGDTNGIGYELIFKTFEDPEMLELCTPIIYGSPKVATYHRNVLEMQPNFTIINDGNEIQDGRVNFMPAFDEEIKVEFGTPTENSGLAGLHAIDRALVDYNEGYFDVLVTAPLENNQNFQFSGQSRYIEDHLEVEGQGLNILLNQQMRMALVTRNLPLKQVAESITKANIKEKITLLHRSLKRDFRLSNPRIAMLGLNPKAGEDGLLGSEEQEIIVPATKELAKEGIQVFGPYAADRFFAENQMVYFDAVLAMYYDQGVIPFRTLTFDDAQNYLAGLPLVRTAPELTPGFDIAGKGIADPAAMRHAIFLAIDIFRHRKEYDEPMANPLQKLYHEKRDENDKVRFNIPKKQNESSIQNGSE